jgi:hypothetical protein
MKVEEGTQCLKLAGLEALLKFLVMNIDINASCRTTLYNATILAYL